MPELMSQPLRILHLEDEPDFSDLVRALFDSECLPVTLRLVVNEEGFQTALAREHFDAILADYKLPDYDGLQALRWARISAPDTPFLLVSGTICEQAAIESLKAGATDSV